MRMGTFVTDDKLSPHSSRAPAHSSSPAFGFFFSSRGCKSHSLAVWRLYQVLVIHPHEQGGLCVFVCFGLHCHQRLLASIVAVRPSLYFFSFFFEKEKGGY
jgi:hypothetical protein